MNFNSLYYYLYFYSSYKLLSNWISFPYPSSSFGVSKKNGRSLNLGWFITLVSASNPIFPSPIFACLSLCEPNKFILSFKCIAYNFSNPITLSNVYPTKDEDGIKEQGYTFKVINNTNKEEVIFYLQNTLKEQENSLNYKYIRYQVTKNNKIIVKPTNIKENGILFTDDNTNESTYEIKMWIDYNSDNNVYGKNFSTKLALL